ncbi:LapA family protein [Caldisalinibacter kiritimatiensis]|uniref:Lipopolysaccharide assembly protein A domain-containing protein n=1 Tax=Caldisalinibacter kiritimatiensis TaxID=1304284 RepID=R1CPQ9_9FIRM|nr:LapA family protein [Caldisalinibacter kiritimatiensis]EOD00661.1 hypothetical protein L21TH_1262 [Caldisalinibacter kiritimatiensis]
MQIGFIFSLVFAIIIAVFALQNGEVVSVDFLFASVEVSQAIVIFVSAALGAFIVSIMGVVRQVKLKLKLKDQDKKIKEMSKTNEELETRILELNKELEVNKSIEEKMIKSGKEDIENRINGNKEKAKSESVE